MQIGKSQNTNLSENFSQRNDGLDLLRSIAILIVLLQHSLFTLPPIENQVIVSIINILDGVSIFFVLSGFLIGKLLLRTFIEQEASFQSLFTFLKRRWLRTIPSYYLVLTIVLALSIYKNTNDDFWNHLSYYFFLQNINFEISKFYPEAWSLSIEEWFYLLFPLLLFLFIRLFKKKQALIVTILIFLLFPLLLRLIVAGNDNDFEFRKLLVFRLDAIVYGVLIAYFKCFNGLYFSKMKNYLFFIGLVLLVAISIFKFKNTTAPFTAFFFSLEALSYCFFIPFIYSLNFAQNGISGRLNYFISTRSYSLYLINLSLVLGFVLPFFKDQLQILNKFPLLNFVLFWIFNFLIAELIYRFFERPILKWRDKNVT